MQKVTFKKLSILGLVLMAASAVTAAIVPNKAKDDKAFAAGSLTRNTGEGQESLAWTCSVSDGNADEADQCTATDATSTTGAGVGDQSASNTGAGNLNTTGR